jgi:hypothetical protein
MLHAEAARFLTSRFVPRLLLTGNGYLHKPYALIEELQGHIQKVCHRLRLTTKSLERYRPYYPPSAVPPEATRRFQTKVYEVIARWVNWVARYLSAARSMNNQPHNTLQMAIRVVDKTGVQQKKFRDELWIHCTRFRVRTTVYAEDDAQSEQNPDNRKKWAMYGGVIDRRTWERDWMTKLLIIQSIRIPTLVQSREGVCVRLSRCGTSGAYERIATTKLVFMELQGSR